MPAGPIPMPDFSTKANLTALKSGNAFDSSVWGRPSNGLAVNEGTVTFTCGSVSVQASVTNGLATGVLVGVSPGSDSVQASYSGGEDFQASSWNVTLTVQ